VKSAAALFSLCMLSAPVAMAEVAGTQAPLDFGAAWKEDAVQTLRGRPGLHPEALPDIGAFRLAEGASRLPAPGSDAGTSPGRDSRVPPGTLRWRNAAIGFGAAGLVAIYGANNWWQDGFRGGFRTVSEGWFGQNTEYGGADKLGHAFFSYVGARLLTTGFTLAGNEPQSAVIMGTLWSLGIMTGVEVLDGFSKKYRFSTEDAVMNVIGAAAGYVMERNPKLDALIDLRLHYNPSDNSNFNIGGDYSGQTYLLAVKASGVPALRSNDFLRYFELAVGYGTRGYEDPPDVERRRNLYFGITLNMSEVLRQTVFRCNTKPTMAQRASELFFEFIQLPGTAAPLAKHQF
jgi:hypothetical protein